MKHQLKPNTYTDPQIHKAVEGKTVTLSEKDWQIVLSLLDEDNGAYYPEIENSIKEQLNNR